MMTTNRRNFIKRTAMAAVAFGFAHNSARSAAQAAKTDKGKRIGMIGLDTGHSKEFAKSLNAPGADSYLGYRVVAAYPKGTENITEWKNQIPALTADVKSRGVEIVDSMEELLDKVDVVLLTCIDGNRHLEQALPVIRAGKPLFIDKPFTASLSDAYAIAEAAKAHNVPLFSSSSLRYMEGMANFLEKTGKVTGADAYSPSYIEEHHPDLFWYGIHGVEILFTVMGAGCKSVQRIATEHTDCVTGIWKDRRIGTFRGIRSGAANYGATVFGEKGIKVLDNYTGYDPLLVKIAEFYDSGISPVPIEETLEIIAFMEAAEESKRNRGAAVDMEALMSQRYKTIKNK
jgi:predicted dehydrogenase